MAAAPRRVAVDAALKSVAVSPFADLGGPLNRTEEPSVTNW
jgi:hypothetical protein